MSKLVRLACLVCLLSGVLATGLTACSFQREAGDEYVASIPAAGASPRAVVAAGAPSLKVMLPDMPTRLDTRRVALERSDGATDYYAEMRWPDFLPLVLQAALVRDLAASGRFSSVIADTSPLPTQNLLQTRVIDFAVQHAADGKYALVRLRYQVLHGEQAGAFDIVEGRSDLQAETPSGIRDALGRAYAQATAQLIEKVASQAVAAGKPKSDRKTAKATTKY